MTECITKRPVGVGVAAGLAGAVALCGVCMSVVRVGPMEPNSVEHELAKVAQRVEMWALRHGRVPTPAEGLGAVFQDEHIPTDPWGRPWRYVAPGPGDRPFDLVSFGADDQPGGVGEAADVRWSDDW